MVRGGSLHLIGDVLGRDREGGEGGDDDGGQAIHLEGRADVLR